MHDGTVRRKIIASWNDSTWAEHTMPPKHEPSTAREAYKLIIDQLVEEASHGVAERLVREPGISSKAYNQADVNELVQSMLPAQRQVLADLLHEERLSAIARTLSILTWWMFCRDVQITFRGEPMPLELTEEGLHGDFLARCDGWEWLDDTGSAQT